MKSTIHAYDIYCTSIIVMYEFILYRRKKESLWNQSLRNLDVLLGVKACHI